jgi:GAF domain-containing protein
VPNTEDQLTASVAELSGVLLSEQTVDELLHTVVELAKRTVPGADGVSVSLVRNGRVTTSHATDDVVLELDSAQYHDGDGPCLDAIRRGRVVTMEVVSDRHRYPAFADVADRRFITAALATPLAAGEQVLGGLNCYSATEGGFGPDEAEVAAMFARHASVLVANAVTLAEASSTNDQLQQALLSRDVIGQAKGVLMEREGCTADEAFHVLRRTSQRENRKLTAVARELAEDRRPRSG